MNKGNRGVSAKDGLDHNMTNCQHCLYGAWGSKDMPCAATPR